jgi:hypothetical protein
MGEFILVVKILKGGFPGGGCAEKKGIRGCIVKPVGALSPPSGGDLRFCDTESKGIWERLMYFFGG